MRKIAIVGGGQSGSQLALSVRALFPRKEGFQFLIGHPPVVGLKFDSLE